MALVTPAGLAADFTVTRTTNNDVIWSAEDNVGTLNSGGTGSVIRLTGNGHEYELCRFRWSDNDGDRDWRPNFGDKFSGSPLRDYANFDTDFVGKSFYVYLSNDDTLYTFVINDNDWGDNNEISWRTGSGNHGQLRPSTFGNGDSARIIIANDNQAAVVGNFVRGIELLRPGTAFTYVVNNLEVTFTDTSTNDPTSWYWEFMGGQTSTQQNPTFTYTSAGTKVVTMTATNAQGSGSTITKRFATTEPPPPPAADPGLMLLTAGTNEDARFLVTAGTASEWYNSGTSVGSVTGDVDLPPTVGRIRLLSSNRFILNRGTGQNFSAYKSANSGKSLFVLTDTLIEFPLSAGSAGGGFIRWETTDAVWAVLDVISTGEKVLFVFADAGSVAKPATANLTPSAPTVANQTGVVSSAFTTTLPVGTGGDGTLTYGVSGLPSWASFAASTRILSGTPDATGVTTITYTVTDTDGDTATTTFTITIAAANKVPAAPTVANQTGVVSSAFTTTLPVGTGGDGTLTYGVSGLPSWASFAASTRILSGTPDATGVTTITYTVTDTDGDTATTTFTITIAAANKVPAAPTVANQTGVVSSAFTTTLPVGTGGDGTLTYGVSGLPSWASFAASTRILSGTPDATGVTTITYTVTDTDGDTATTTFTITIAAASLTPTGILADFTVTVTATITATAKGYIWWESRNVGTLKSGSDVTIDLEDSDDIVLDELIWNDSTPHFDLRPFLHRKSGSFSTAATELAGHSLYLWDGTTVYEQRFDAVSVIQTDRVGWRTTPRPAGIVVGSVVRAIIAEADQATKVKKFVQVAPVASFTSVVAELTVQFMDTSTERPTSWAWNFGDGGTSTDQNPSHIYTSANTYTVTLTATNTIGSNAATAQVTAIAPPDLRPVAPVVPNETGIVGTSLSFTLPVGTGGDAPLAYLASGLPSWATFTASTRVLSGTPNATGVTTVTYTVTDTDGDTATVTFTITIAPKPRVVPTAPTVADQNGVVGTTFALSLPVGTGGDAPLTYLVSGLPSGLTFFANFRAVGGTPETAGISTVTYTVTDNDGDTDISQFTITIVDNAVLPGKITSITLHAGDEQATIDWALPYNGGAPITRIDLQYQGRGLAAVTVALSSTATDYTILKLVNNLPYTIQVRAVNRKGTASYSDAQTVTPREPIVVNPPEKLQVKPEDTAINVSWYRPYSDRITKLLLFVVQYKITGSTTWKKVETTNTALRIEKLLPETTYEIRVYSIDRTDIGIPTKTLTTTTFPAVGVNHDYRILVDWDDTNEFPYDDLTHINNITPYVLEASWNFGFKEMFNKVSGRTECKIILRNDKDLWAPENVNSPFIQKGWTTKEVRVYLYSRDSSGVETIATQLFTGIIYFLRYANPLLYGNQRVEMVVHGVDQALKDTDFVIRPSINRKPEQMIRDVLEYSRIRPVLRPKPLTLDLPGYNILGTSYIESPVDTQFDESYFNFPAIVNDIWSAGSAPYDAVADLVEASGGKMFVNRDGLLEFWNRLHWIHNDGLYILNRYTGANYEYLSDLQKDTTKNTITLTYKRIETTNNQIERVYFSTEELKIPVRETIDIDIEYTVNGLKRIASYVQFPILSDLTYTGIIEIGDFTYDHETAKLTLVNTGNIEAVITIIRIYGQSVTEFGDDSITVTDFDSAVKIGIRTMELNLNVPITRNHAVNIINTELDQRRDVRGYVTKATFDTRDSKEYFMLHYMTIGDYIYINLPKMHHKNKYIIIGEEHKLTEAASHHIFSFFLEPVPTGHSRIGEVDSVGKAFGQPLGEEFLLY